MPEAVVRAIPPITFPPELPVVQRREDIAAAISAHQVVIIAGETGSGKTTQIPKICLQLGRGREARIGHTQPRRLAARTVAQRISEELQVPLGDTVGYQVRFTDQVSDASAIKLMTDGILLAEIRHDRLLRRYDTLIIDEAHERSLNIDFLLGYLKQLLPKRPDLKLIITSATIDVDSFSRHFGDAPIIEVSGRSYPVETVYLDPAEDRDLGLQEQIVGLVGEIEAGRFGERGDILVFLPGERDIRELARQLRGQERLEVLPLYARLTQAEQSRVFDLKRRRGMRVVLATNVAETSVTVPGIRYVIDPGEARISRYSFRTKVQRLPIEPISQASANQRQGRCGRVAAGVCIRLYTEADFLSRPEFTDPEILRTSLAAVILQMLQLGLGELQRFPFINPPDPRMVRDGYKLLQELGAVTGRGKLTATGKRMARLPVDPRLARMVLAAQQLGCLDEVLVIAAALAIQDPRERPTDKQTQADQMHARFRHPRSDFMAWLALWRYYEEQRQALSQSQLRKLCQREFLSFLRLREWRDMHAQLRISCRQLGLHPAAGLPAVEEESYDAVHKALLAGLLSNIAQHQEDREYLGSRNRKLQIFPGSALGRQRPKWLVAAEIVETSKVFARTVGTIDPAWVLETNPELLKFHYYEPRWEARQGRAMASERVTLYGLTVADKRPVHYGPINPVESRELLIREGLIAGRFPRHPGFLKHNLKLLRTLEDLEARARRRDLLADEQVLFSFYDERLPADITTADRLRAWVAATEGADASLRVPRELLLARDPGSALGQQFPDRLCWGDMEFRLSYQFEPGQVADGVSVTVPVGLLNRVPRFRFDWLVPGLLRDKCIALVKGLPKDKRKQLVPVPDTVDRALAVLEPADEDLCVALARVLSRLGSVPVAARDLQPEKLDPFYHMNIRVVDADGKLLNQGRDLAALVTEFRSDTRQTITSATASSPAREGLTSWAIDALPREWRFRQAGTEIVAWPALVDKGESVAVELCDYPGQALLQHRLGVLRLLRLQQKQQVRFLRKQLLLGNETSLLLAAAGQERVPLVDDLIDAAWVQVAGLNDALPRDETGFKALLARSGEVVARATELETNLLNALKPLAELQPLLARYSDASWAPALADMRQQLAQLWQPGFQRDTPADWLPQYPRYMKALKQRLERLNGQLPRDTSQREMLQRLALPLQEACLRRPGLLALCVSAQQYRWMLEEFRVSLFAQQLGTRVPVSDKRLQEQWESVQAWLDAHPGGGSAA
ncbi:ATP-dependent RNA helicase HrpA [Haliea sp. E1-2-M8]|uniref:ATP-dependent RNA helicase HrpA n=1 Tax=Haliea sp. E1-2-M8 TaxID=3064706 RepID=UPI00272495BC|nr:ATP-dependent RNA helicase HrpA [Haliea sp. E1-2-M8]MDO8861203.1 ATP-dependent RNA helicase HrpA [Haliea sp. E1-2-M8]